MSDIRKKQEYCIVDLLFLSGDDAPITLSEQKKNLEFEKGKSDHSHFYPIPETVEEEG